MNIHRKEPVSKFQPGAPCNLKPARDPASSLFEEQLTRQ